VREWGGHDFIILDTLARCMVGADEDSAKDCGIVVDALTRLLSHTPGGRGVALGVHHAGKDGKNTARLIRVREWRGHGVFHRPRRRGVHFGA
jgi:hypothetical protein